MIVPDQLADLFFFSFAQAAASKLILIMSSDLCVTNPHHHRQQQQSGTTTFISSSPKCIGHKLNDFNPGSIYKEKERNGRAPLLAQIPNLP